MCYEKNDYFRAQEVYENIYSRGISLTNQTKRAYHEAVKIVESFKSSFSHTFPRIELILAWLTIKLDKFEPAITQLEDLMDSSPSIEALNLLLYAMLKNGQIKGTIEEINFWMKPFPIKVKLKPLI